MWNNTDVVLLKGVEENNLFLDNDQLAMLLVENSTSRNINDLDLSSESTFTLKDFETAISKIYLCYEVPKISAESEDEIMNNIEIIQNDFPNYSIDEILLNYNKILDLYHQQIKYLVVKTIKSENSLSSRGVPTIGVGEDGLYYNKKLFTWYETKACVAHPLSAVTLYSAVEKTRSITAQVYGSYTITDERSDAFRHTVLNINLAKYGVGMRDEKLKWASDFCTAHEKERNDKGAPSYMDLHNNRIGRSFYKSNTNIKYRRIKAFGKTLYKIAVGVTSEPTDSEMKNEIKKMADIAQFIPGYDKNNHTAENERLVEGRIDQASSEKLVFILNK